MQGLEALSYAGLEESNSCTNFCISPDSNGMKEVGFNSSDDAKKVEKETEGIVKRV